MREVTRGPNREQERQNEGSKANQSQPRAFWGAEQRQPESTKELADGRHSGGEHATVGVRNHTAHADRHTLHLEAWTM